MFERLLVCQYFYWPDLTVLQRGFAKTRCQTVSGQMLEAKRTVSVTVRNYLARYLEEEGETFGWFNLLKTLKAKGITSLNLHDFPVALQRHMTAEESVISWLCHTSRSPRSATLEPKSQNHHHINIIPATGRCHAPNHPSHRGGVYVLPRAPTNTTLKKMINFSYWTII